MLFEIDRDPPARVLRLFGGVWLPLFLAVAATIALRRGAEAWWPAVLFGAAAASVGVALARPSWLRFVYVALMVVTWPLGWLLSHVVLGVIYFAVITPAGLLLRAIGKDPLRKRGSAAAASYWSPRRQPADVERYFRQY